MKKGTWMRTLVCGLLAMLVAVNVAYAKDSKKDAEKHYPNASRSEPKSDLTNAGDQKALQAAIDAVNSGDDAKAQEAAQKVIDSSKSKYAQGIALQVLANTKFNAGDYKGAIADYQKLLALNSLPNDAHFDSWYNMINAYVGDEQYQKAGEELKKWRAEGKRETPDSYALEGNIDYRMEKYPEAIEAIKKAQSMTDQPKESWNSILMASYNAAGQSGQAAGVIDQQLAKNPNDKKTIQNALVIYSQSNENEKAEKLLDREHSQGLLTDENDYVTAAKIYARVGQQADNNGDKIALKGATVLQEGITKGAVKPTLENYKLLGDAYMIGNDHAKALEAYAKAAPLATNGDIDYTRAQVLGAEQEFAQSKEVLQKAIARGVTHKGKAYLLLGKLNMGLKDSAGARAAFEQAAKDPETASEAAENLKKVRGGK